VEYRTVAPSQDETFRRALAALQAGKATGAERLFKELLSVDPKHVAGLNLLGISLTKLGRLEEAETYFQRALKENAASDATFYNYGIILKALKRPVDALERFSQALAINSKVAETWNNRGTVFNDLKRYSEAVDDFDKAISINPKYAEAYYNKGKSLAQLRIYDQSLRAFDAALALRPDLAEASSGRGYIFTELKQYDDAFAAYDTALRLKPDLAEAWRGRGNIFSELKRYDDAFAAYDTALRLKPDLAEVWLGRGEIFSKLKRYDDAFAAYDTALALKPDLKFAKGARLHAKLMMGDWAKIDTEIADLLSEVRDQKPVSVPFVLLSIPASCADQLQCAKTFVSDKGSFSALWSDEIYSHDRIRIGYLSADFRNHALAQLAVGLFEHHDKSRFEIMAISCGADDGSDLRNRIRSAAKHFINVSGMPDSAIAEFIRRREIDILVDQSGFTQDSRFSVFARRASPLQVNFLCYTGTMGADCIDYIIADPTVIPKDHFPFYSEKVVWLPDTYQANDRSRPTSGRRPTRSECNLADAAFVFCCFNAAYKITPEVFGVWMRLLAKREGSVLWLLQTNPTAAQNLRREAEAHGIAPKRLIFAPVMPFVDHMARIGLADLFLDTLPYNAHTTASDALWAGVPVLTCLGDTFAGRVAASLLKAVGLDELITTSLEDYEILALKLAQDRALLASLREKVERNRETYPLFNTARFARHIEAAYMTMWERQQKGAAPQSFAVDPIN
jgi:protein O-GlcNAc transferase